MKKLNSLRWLASLLTLLIVVICPISVLASGADDTASLTIMFTHEKQPVAGINYRIYRVADRGLEMTELFSGYSVTLKDLDSQGLTAAAATLAAYAARDNVPADAEGATNARGGLNFSDLLFGVYLVVGDLHTGEDGIIYIPQPFLVQIPYVDEAGNVTYDVVAEPKYDIRYEGEELAYRVLKIWDDNGRKERPTEIVVQLLCDGKIYEEVTLNAENNWRYAWSGLDAAHVWQITEKTVPDGYTVKVEQQGITLTVTNTYENPDEPGTPPPSSGGGNKLPQLGQLWWPVPILMALGVMFMTTGFVVRRREYNA